MQSTTHRQRGEEFGGDDHGDFRIAFDGTWYHDGGPIRREALARLFATRALTIDEQGDYWLKTPYERYPVTVEDAPFVIVDYTVKDGAIDLTTNMGERVPLGPDHPLILKRSPVLKDTLPYVEVRDGLYARMSRTVYYALAHRFGATVLSRGETYPLGPVEE